MPEDKTTITIPEQTKKIPRIGIGVIVLSNAGEILLGKRRNARGSGTWSPPGGHLDFGESPSECAKRELFEETGLIAVNVREFAWTNDVFREEQKHYITFFMIVEEFIGTVELKEPEKCDCWKWINKNELPQPLFLPLANLLTQKAL